MKRSKTSQPRWGVVLVLIVIALWLLGEEQRKDEQDALRWRHCIRHDAPWDCPR